MVEVFQTNVHESSQARELVALLRPHFRGSKINIDLDDCDKVLRVEGKEILVEKVIGLVTGYGFACKVLE
jgi:hypothetical protein